MTDGDGPRQLTNLPATEGPPAPTRTIVAGDGIAWLSANALPPTHAVVTSLPDVSEMRSMDLDA